MSRFHLDNYGIMKAVIFSGLWITEGTIEAQLAHCVWPWTCDRNKKKNEKSLLNKFKVKVKMNKLNVKKQKSGQKSVKAIGILSPSSVLGHSQIPILNGILFCKTAFFSEIRFAWQFWEGSTQALRIFSLKIYSN